MYFRGLHRYRAEYTAVPGKLLNKGIFPCVSCHNPHPSNANYTYLITATGEDASTSMGVDPNVEPIVRISQQASARPGR